MGIDSYVGVDSSSFHSYYYQAYKSFRESMGLDTLVIPASYREQLLEERNNRDVYDMAGGYEASGRSDNAMEQLRSLQNRANELRLHNQELWDWRMDHPLIIQSPLGEQFFPDPGAESPQARRIQEATRELAQFAPPFQIIPSALEKVADMRAQERQDAHGVPIDLPNITSISGPVMLAEPVMISGPVMLSGPPPSMNPPYEGPNRRKDTLGSGSLKEGDIDGPYDLADYQMLTQLGIAHGDALYLAQQARLQGTYLAEDLEEWLRIQQNSVSDANFVLEQWAASNSDASAAFAHMVEIDQDNAKQADRDFYLYQGRLVEDLESAYAYGQSISSGQSDPAILTDPVDTARASEDIAMISGFYPLDRPAHALYAAPVWTEQEPPGAQVIREDLEEAGASPEAQTRYQQLVYPERPQEEKPQEDFQPKVFNLGYALDPVSIGVSSFA